jgi:hypothetical protein
VTLTGAGDPVRLPAGFVSHGVRPALGVMLPLGRPFAPGDDRPDSDVVLLGDGLWRRSFGGAPDVVGRSVVLDGRSRTVAGVLPADFRLPDEFGSAQPAELLVPLGIARGTVPRGSHFLLAVGRLAPGVSRQQAAARVASVAARFKADMPAEYVDHLSAVVTSLHDDVVRGIRPTLLILTAAIGFVLLVACVNVTNLLLSRGERRRQELATRMALGASPGRVVTLVLRQGVTTAALGSALGVAGGVGLGRFLEAVLYQVSPGDPFAVAAATTIAVAAALLACYVPARRAAHADPMLALRAK